MIKIVLYLGGERGGQDTIKKEKTKHKIYISIACLGKDEELINTIESIYKNAKYPKNVNIGISFTGNIEFYEFIKNKYKNIKTKYYSYEENAGVGNGRLSAASMYDNEEHFLQIDAHSYMFENWDKYLIDKYAIATNKFNSDKIIFSGSLPSYEYINNEMHTEKMLKYSFYNTKEFTLDSILMFNSYDPTTIYQNFYLNNEDEFKPLLKTVAAFMFGSRELATNLGLDKDIIFWEEEIIQTINLINDGFILLHPGPNSPLTHFSISSKNHDNCNCIGVEGRHRYKEHGRSDISEIYSNSVQMSLKKYHSFLLDINNYQKIKKYEQYANLDMITGPKEEYFYPKQFINLKEKV